jgi:glyoxylase-like metal-dependent hydrolase (beta-lactamase superfamily II)
MHPDHVGLAGWLTRKFGCRLWMTRLEYLNCRVVVSDHLHDSIGFEMGIRHLF